jgi:Cu+-exporting ATPase
VTDVVLDKTGTLTQGRPEVTDVATDGSVDDPVEVLRLAAGAERASEHPLASAVIRRAGAAGVNAESLAVGGFAAIPGGGVAAVVDGHEVLVGSARLLGERGVAEPPVAMTVAAEVAEAAGRTAVWVARDGAAVGVLEVADRLKPHAEEAVATLRSSGLEAWLLSGDRAVVAGAVAREVGIADDRVVGDVLPAGKAEAVAALQGEGRRVAMVGDGLNDAPALAQADLGVAIGSGSDVAVEASDLTILGDDLRSVATGIGLARATMRTIRQNLVWAFGYNVLLIPVAAGILYPFTGWTLNPALAAGAMALSSVSVVTNSLRLRRFTTRSAAGVGTPG